MSNVTSPKHVAASLTEHWSPRIVAEVDDSYIKVAKVNGSLAWHSHENEDELFFVLKGHGAATLKVAEDAGAVTINYGAFINTILNFLIVAFVLFVIQLFRSGDYQALGPGAWLCFAGATVALIGGYFGSRTVVVAGPPPSVVTTTEAP